jgi:predicted O-methyltransferase YrrM
MSAMSWYGSHDYLNEFIQKNACRGIMEIGVYNGDNALSMIQAAIMAGPATEVKYYGFDFFSNYSTEQIGQKLGETGCKLLLFEGNTLDTVPDAAETLPKMDLIFIDGGKSFMEAWSDWEASSRLMHSGTGVFVHNVGFSGVSRMVESISRDSYEVEMLFPRFEGKVALIRKKGSSV